MKKELKVNNPSQPAQPAQPAQLLPLFPLTVASPSPTLSSRTSTLPHRNQPENEDKYSSTSSYSTSSITSTEDLFSQRKASLLKLLAYEHDVIEEILEGEQRALQKKNREVSAEINELKSLIENAPGEFKNPNDLEKELKALKEWRNKYLKTLNYNRYIMSAPYKLRECAYSVAKVFSKLETNESFVSTRDNPLFIMGMINILQAFFEHHPNKFLIIAQRAIRFEWLAETNKSECLRSGASLAQLLLSEVLEQYFPTSPSEWAEKYPLLKTKELLFRFVVNFGSSHEAIRCENDLLDWYINGGESNAATDIKQNVPPKTKREKTMQGYLAKHSYPAIPYKNNHEPFFDYLWDALRMANGLKVLSDQLFNKQSDFKSYDLGRAFDFGAEEYLTFSQSQKSQHEINQVIDGQKVNIIAHISNYIAKHFLPVVKKIGWAETQACYDKLKFILEKQDYKSLPIDIYKSIQWLVVRIEVDCVLAELAGTSKSKATASSLREADSKTFELIRDLDNRLNQAADESDSGGCLRFLGNLQNYGRFAERLGFINKIYMSKEAFAILNSAIPPQSTFSSPQSPSLGLSSWPSSPLFTPPLSLVVNGSPSSSPSLTPSTSPSPPPPANRREAQNIETAILLSQARKPKTNQMEEEQKKKRKEKDQKSDEERENSNSPEVNELLSKIALKHTPRTPSPVIGSGISLASTNNQFSSRGHSLGSTSSPIPLSSSRNSGPGYSSRLIGQSPKPLSQPETRSQTSTPAKNPAPPS